MTTVKQSWNDIEIDETDEREKDISSTRIPNQKSIIITLTIIVSLIEVALVVYTSLLIKASHVESQNENRQLLMTDTSL